MINWNTDAVRFKKEHPEQYKVWRLAQLINYGLDGEKLDKKETKQAWEQIKDRLDPDRRKTVEFFLWGKSWHKEQGLRADRKNFWQWYFKRHIFSKNSI